MAKVAELSVDIDADDRATAKIMAVDALIKGLGGDVVTTVDADVAGATAELERFKQTADALDGRTIKVNTDVDNIIAQLDAITKKTLKIDVEFDMAEILAMRELLGQDLSIDVDTRNAMAAIAALRAQLEAIVADDTINVDFDAGAALAELNAFEARLIAATRDREVNVRVDTSGLPSLDQLASSATRASGQVRGVTAAILAVGPALVPLVAVGTAGALALGAGFLAAGAGVAAFGGVIYSVYKPVTDALDKMKTQQDAFNRAVTDKQRATALAKEEAIWNSLTASQQRAAQGISQLQSAWQKLVDTMTNSTLDVTGRALSMLASAIPALTPMLMDMTVQFDGLLTSLEASVQSPFWQRFLANMSEIAGPMAASLVRSFGNIITGIAGILSAFLPMSSQVTFGLEDLTARFSRWGQELGSSPGFRAFTAYVLEAWPIVRSTIRAVADAFVELIQAAAPIGESILKSIRGVAQAIADLGEEHPRLLSIALGAVGITIAFLNMLGPVVAIAAAFLRFRAGALAVVGVIGQLIAPLGLTIGMVAGAIGVVLGLAAALVLAYKNSETFRAVMDDIGSRLADAWARVKQSLADAVTAIKSFIDEQTADWRQWWADNEAVLSEASAFIQDTISTLLDEIGREFSGAWSILTGAVRLAWAVITGIISGAMDIIRGVLLIWAGVLAGDWEAIWNGLVSVVIGVVNLIVEPLKRLWEEIKQIFAENGIDLEQLWSDMWNGLTSTDISWSDILSAVWDGFLAALGAAEDLNAAVSQWFSGLWSNLTNGLGDIDWPGILSAVWAGFLAALGAAEDLNAAVSQWFSDLWSSLTSSSVDIDWSGILSAVWNGFLAALGAAEDLNAAVSQWFSDLWTGLTNAIPDIDWSGIISAIGSSLVSALGTSTGNLGSQISTWFSGLWSSLSSVQVNINWSGVVSWIVDGFLAALTAVGAALATSIATWFSGLFTGLTLDLDWVGNVASWIAAPFQAALEALNLSQIISDWWNNAWEGIKSFGSMIKEKLFGGGDTGAGAQEEITTQMDALIATMTAKFAELNQLWIDGWTTLAALNTTVWVGINAAVAAQMAGVVLTVQTGFLGIQTAWIDGWAQLSALNTIAWVGIQAAVAAQMVALGATITAGFTVLQANWTAGWATLAASTTTAWTTIQAAVAQEFLTLQSTFAAGFTVLASSWTAGWATLATGVAAGWAPIQTAIAAQFLTLQSTFVAGFTVLASSWTAGWATLTLATTTAWASIQSAVTAQFVVLQALIVGNMAQINAVWTAGWTAILASATASWTSITTLVSSQMIQIAALVTAGMTQIQTIWTTSWAAMLQIATTSLTQILALFTSTTQQMVSIWTAGFAQLVAAVTSGAQQMVSTITAMGASIISTLNSVAAGAYSAGASIGANLAAGIQSQVAAVSAAAQQLAAAATAPLPGSPAEIGPLSGRGYALLRGQRMVEDLAAGLSRTTPVTTAMGDLADLMALSVAPSAAMNAIVAGRNVLGQGGGDIIVEAGAVQVSIGDGVDPAEAREAFSDAGQELASLLTALRRR